MPQSISATFSYDKVRSSVLPLLALLLCAGGVLPADVHADEPTPAHNCQVDPRGANDKPGQKDITQFCVSLGDSAPFELHTITSFDETEISGSNTIDACMLFNTDGDAFADLAACVTMGTSGGDNRLTAFQSLNLYRCNDTKADRCMSSALVTGPYQSRCEVAHPDNDPFSPAAKNGPGDAYPLDSEIACSIDLDDFRVVAQDLRLLDACSFPSSQPNSDAEDCILYAPCTTAEACDDGNACSVDTCDPGGVCKHTAAGPIACTDGLFCSGAETCNALGFCEGSGLPLDCDDDIGCTIDDCDEFADACVHDPRGSLCDDARFCNGIESCNAASGCVAGDPPDCRDDVACTTDTCSPLLDACSHSATDGLCDDGLSCNGAETCDVSAGCMPGVTVSCDDGIACTADRCDEAAGGCLHDADDSACSDGLFCNGDETCDLATGCTSGGARTCNDGVACTDDVCDEQADLCVNSFDNSECDDGRFCNGVESCSAGGCGPGEPPCPGLASCNEDADVCAACSADVDCDDGVYCNGREACTGGVCLGGLDVACDDGLDCTLDRCDEVSATCTHMGSDALCSDGRFCNGAESCDPDAGCRAGAIACDDGVECTLDSCNENLDTCDHQPQHAVCDNGRYCDGRETCDSSAGCVEGDEVVCGDDAFQCTTERCSEDTDRCERDFSRCVCGDREVVGLEECDPPARAGSYEDCNNLLDDDGDGAADCVDSECLPGSGRGPICDEVCRVDLACARVARDPAIIRFDRHERPDRLWIHGRFPIAGASDPLANGFEIQVSNRTQPIYRAALGAGDLEANANDETQFYFDDDDARFLGNESQREGLSRVGINIRSVNGVPYLAFRVRAYGDFSEATDRNMTSQITIGSEVGSLTSEWSAARGKWVLHQRDF